MPDHDTTPQSARTNGGLDEARDALAWVREHWVAVALAAALVVGWLATGETRREIGRFALVKDNVPCEILRGQDDDGTRRWCYVLLDTESGKLEERLRKLKLRDKR